MEVAGAVRDVRSARFGRTLCVFVPLHKGTRMTRLLVSTFALFALLVAGPASAGPLFATWNQADAHAEVVLSADLLTASRVAGLDEWVAVRATIPVTSGSWYWETTVTYSGTADFGVGMLWRSTPWGLWLDQDPGAAVALQPIGVAVNNAGDVRFAGWSRGNVGAVSSGSVVRHWLDMDAKFYRVAVNGGAWVEFSDGLGWFNWPGIQRTPVAAVTSPDAEITANFGATPFAHAVPPGANPGLYLPDSVLRSGFEGGQ